MSNGIVLFDGECNFCNGSVQFIIKRDKLGYFKFASLQSSAGQTLLKNYSISTDVDSIIFIENNRTFIESAAVLQICKHLDGAWKLCTIVKVVPLPIRNRVYKLIAKNRYKWFGKRQECMIPTVEQRQRFLKDNV